MFRKNEVLKARNVKNANEIVLVRNLMAAFFQFTLLKVEGVDIN